MGLLRLDKVSLDFGDQRILHDASLVLEADERVCLVGRNGAGKTTLLRIIAGAQEPDEGDIEYASGLRISELPQSLPSELDATVQQYVTAGLASLQALVSDYEKRAAGTPSPRELAELEVLQRAIDAQDGWRLEQRVATTLSELELPADKTLRTLSGGWRRRVALGRALVSRPDLLLLDEPTNHLDITTIEWLEHQVRAWSGSVVFVTHDRAFLQRLATRIVELDRGRLTSWPGSYHQYLRRREQADQAEQKAEALFDKKLAQEEAWIREGIKARRTRNEGRVRALKEMRAERLARPKKEHQARINIDEAEQSGRKVIQARNLNFGYAGQTLIQNFSLRVMRGDRIGIVGNNGVGKSTLLRLLLGDLRPDAGTIKLGTGLEIAYFDQNRTALDLDKSIAENVGDGRDYVRINGKDRHVIGYLRGFLFSPKRAMMPVRALSGGERNRVILAKLFTQPSNLLVLDEPTNDLDIETLEALEARVTEYQGTVIVTSHDREFLDNVVTSVLVFESDGRIEEYVGTYADWARRGRQLAEFDQPDAKAGDESQRSESKAQARPQKLSYKQQRELDALPGQIAALESTLAELQKNTSDGEFFTQDSKQIQTVMDHMQTVNEKLEQAVERWGELEELQTAYQRNRQS